MDLTSLIATNTYITKSLFQKQQQDWKSLDKALQSGDLDDAKKAFESLQKNLPPSRKNSSGQKEFSNTIKNDMQALSNALNEGDMEAAKKAFVTLQQDMQKLRQSEHSHPHQPADLQKSSANDTGFTIGQNLNVVV